MLTFNDQDEYIASQQNAPSWVFMLIWLGWVALTATGYFGGRWIAESAADFLTGVGTATRLFSIEGTLRDSGFGGFFVALVSGAIAGLVLGIAQGILLLPFIKISGALEWLLATVIGRSAQWAALYVIALAMRGLVIDQSFVGLMLLFAMMLLIGVMSGVALAYPQAQVFKRRSSRSSWLIVTTVIGTAGTAFVIAMTMLVESQNTLRNYSTLVTAILCAVATGFALLEILHHPTSTAEWRDTLTWDRDDRMVA